MSEMNEAKRPDEMDEWLRRSLAAPVPTLPPDLDQAVMRRIHRRSQPLDRRARALLAAYALLSAMVSALLMRSQGLGWMPIAGTILITLVIASVIARLSSKPSRRHLPTSS